MAPTQQAKPELAMDWQYPLTFPKLQPDQLHIWRTELTFTPAELLQLSAVLTPSELGRAKRFSFNTHRNHFIAARGILRQLIANYLQCDPQGLEFQPNSYGKLFLSDSELQFNLSHSHGVALFAFMFNHQVGIDLEQIRPNFDFIEIAQRWFAPEEYLALTNLAPAEQCPAFFNCWSQKEAFVKTLGIGIGSTYRRFATAVSVAKDGPVALSFDPTDFGITKLSLELLDPGPYHSGAFAVTSSCYIPHFFEFTLPTPNP